MSEPLIQINPAWDAQTQANWRAMQALRQAQNNQGGVDTRALADIRNMAAQAVSQVGQVNVKVENLQKALGSLQSSDPDLSEVEDAIEGLRSSVSTLEGLALLSGGGPTEAFPIQVPEKSTYWVGSDPEDDFSTVQEAIDYLAPMVMMNTTTIRVKPGVYSNGGGTVAKFQAIPFASNLVLQGDTRAGIGSTWFIHTGTALAYDGVGTTFKLADKADAVATGKVNGIAAGDKVYLYGWGTSQDGEQTILEVNSAAGTLKVSGDMTGAAIDRASTCSFLPNVVFEGWGATNVIWVSSGCPGLTVRGIGMYLSDSPANTAQSGMYLMGGSTVSMSRCACWRTHASMNAGAKGFVSLDANSNWLLEAIGSPHCSVVGKWQYGALMQTGACGTAAFLVAAGCWYGIFVGHFATATLNSAFALNCYMGFMVTNTAYAVSLYGFARNSGSTGVYVTNSSRGDWRFGSADMNGNTANYSPPTSGVEGNSGSYVIWS